MKITVTLKDPDGFSESVDDAVKEELAAIEGLGEEDRDELFESRQERCWSTLKKWVEYQEYVTIEFDTEAGTATVKECK